jgi:hypothetical protein
MQTQYCRVRRNEHVARILSTVGGSEITPKSTLPVPMLRRTTSLILVPAHHDVSQDLFFLLVPLLEALNTRPMLENILWARLGMR